MRDVCLLFRLYLLVGVRVLGEETGWNAWEEGKIYRYTGIVELFGLCRVSKGVRLLMRWRWTWTWWGSSSSQKGKAWRLPEAAILSSTHQSFGFSFSFSFLQHRLKEMSFLLF